MKKLINQLRNAQSLPSVTLIISSSLRSFADKESLVIRIKERINDIDKELSQSYDPDLVRLLVDHLKVLARSVDFRSLSDGIGFFVSRNIQKKVQIEFPVVERTLIANEFDVSDLEAQESALFDYNVLVLSRKETRLFKAKGDKLIPSPNTFFPAIFQNEFQVKRADKFSFYNSEESKINQSRRDSYFRSIDKALEKENQNIPLVIVGTVENLSDFKNIKKSPQIIVAEVNGNMDKVRDSELANKVWDAVYKAVDKPV